MGPSADTEFARIARLTETGGEAVSPLRRELARLSRTIALASVAVGLAFLLLWRKVVKDSIQEIENLRQPQRYRTSAAPGARSRTVCSIS